MSDPKKAANLFGVLAMMAALGYAAPSIALSADSDANRTLSREGILQLVTAAAEGASLETGIGVDPQIVSAMAADALNFAATFCYYPVRPACDTSLFNEPALQRLVKDHLNELAARKAIISTLAGRLATSVDLDMSSGGWNGVQDNIVSVVTIPEEARSATVAIRTAQGVLQLGRNFKVLLLNPGVHEILVALADGVSKRATVELFALSNKPLNLADANGEAITIGRIEVSVGEFCEESIPLPATGALIPFNWGRAKFAESEQVRTSNIAPAATQVTIDIAVTDETGLCGETCHTALGIAFARAIATWRFGCERCDRAALSVIRVGKNTWIDQAFLLYLRALSQASLDETAHRPALPSVPSEGQGQYEQLNHDLVAVRTLCGIASPSVSWIRESQALLCGKGPLPKRELQPTLRITSSDTQCGADPLVVACGVADGNIELSMRDRSFKVPAYSGSFLLSTPDSTDVLNVVPILVHEVGHWYGVPHPEQVGVSTSDVMKGVYMPGQDCVSTRSLRLLNNATDKRWSFRTKGNQGLRVVAKHP